MIRYPGNGVFIERSSDIGKLGAADNAFKAFIGTQADKAQETGQQCAESEHGVAVQKYRSDGFALGAFLDCGGYIALWVRSNGSWREAIGTQEVWRCAELKKFHVPDGFAGECENY